MGIAVLYTLAFVLALVAIMAALGLSQVARSAAGRMFQALMWLLVLASAMAIVMSGRSLRLVDTGLLIDAQSDTATALSAKVVLALAIGFAVVLCVARAMRAWWRRVPRDRFAVRDLHPPGDIVLALLVFYIAFSIVPFALAPDHYFHISLFYPFFIFWALLLWLPYSEVDPVVVIKQTLSVLVLGSLVAAAVAPTLALQPGYAGLIPGFNQRLWGITATANTLGSCALALFMIEVCEPAKRRWLHWLLLVGAAVTMVMSQSKAAVGTATLGTSLVALWRWLQTMRDSAAGRGGRGELMAVLGFTAVASVFIAGVWFVIAEPSLFGSLGRKLDSRAVADLSTGTGRTFIWQFAIEAGLESPIFGHGANFWGLETRLRTGLTGATHAHNQFLQVFSRSGFLGLLSYLWFFGLLVVYAWRALGPTRGGSLVFLLVFFIRSLVEVPLQPNSVLGGEFFAFMMLLVYVIDRGAKPRVGAADAVVKFRPSLGRIRS